MHHYQNPLSPRESVWRLHIYEELARRFLYQSTRTLHIKRTVIALKVILWSSRFRFEDNYRIFNARINLFSFRYVNFDSIKTDFYSVSLDFSDLYLRMYNVEG